ncbi:MAG: hypothetical protein WC708_10475 [Lentisphaeria bacterium]
MWKFQTTELYERRIKRLAKNHPEAVSAALANLQSLFDAFARGTPPSGIRSSFIHPEPGGVIAVDQKGGDRKLTKLHAIRIYAFPDNSAGELIAITAGDKDSQHDDIKDCAAFVKQFRKGQTP